MEALMLCAVLCAKHVFIKLIGFYLNLNAWKLFFSYIEYF